MESVGEVYNLSWSLAMQANIKNTPSVFNFSPDLCLRVFEINEAPWFVAADIEKMFGLSNIRKRISSLDEDEKNTIASPSGGSLTIVNESGLWTLVLRSDAAIQKGTVAYKARKWVTAEVLPAIRKTGTYSLPRQEETILPAEQRQIQDEIARRAKKESGTYRLIYRSIKDHYQIARYDQLPRSLFEDCLEFIRSLILPVPVLETNKKEKSVAATTQIARIEPRNKDRGLILRNGQDGIYLPHTEAMRLRSMLFMKHHTFKQPNEILYQFLSATDSPMRARFWEYLHDTSDIVLEKTLADFGYTMNELEERYKRLPA